MLSDINVVAYDTRQPLFGALAYDYAPAVNTPDAHRDAINTAILTASQQTRRTSVGFHGGTYTVSKSNNLAAINLHPRVSLNGPGWEAVLKLADGQNCNLIRAVPGEKIDNVSICNMTLDPNFANNPGMPEGDVNVMRFERCALRIGESNGLRHSNVWVANMRVLPSWFGFFGAGDGMHVRNGEWWAARHDVIELLWGHGSIEGAQAYIDRECGHVFGGDGGSNLRIAHTTTRVVPGGSVSQSVHRVFNDSLSKRHSLIGAQVIVEASDSPSIVPHGFVNNAVDWYGEEGQLVGLMIDASALIGKSSRPKVRLNGGGTITGGRFMWTDLYASNTTNPAKPVVLTGGARIHNGNVRSDPERGSTSNWTLGEWYYSE